MGAQCPGDFSSEEHRKIVHTVESYAVNGKLTPFAATKLLYWWGRLGLDYTTLQEREQKVVVMVLRCAVTPSVYASTTLASSGTATTASNNYAPAAVPSTSTTHSYSASAPIINNDKDQDASAAVTISSDDAVGAGAVISSTSSSSATNLNPLLLPTTTVPTAPPTTVAPMSDGSNGAHATGGGAAAVEAMHLRDLFEALGGAVRMKLPMPGRLRYPTRYPTLPQPPLNLIHCMT